MNQEWEVKNSGEVYLFPTMSVDRVKGVCSLFEKEVTVISLSFQGISC